MLVVTHAGGSPYHGPNMRWYFLAQALKPLGVSVEIASSSSFHKYLRAPAVDAPLQTECIDDVTYHWIRTRPYTSGGVHQVRNQLEYVYGCYRASRYLSQRKPDVVIASSPHPLVTGPALRIARRARARFIFETRDQWPEVLLQLGGFSELHPYIGLLRAAERRGVKRAERVVSVKAGDEHYFRERWGLPADRFSYVPNGLMPETNPEPAPAMVKGLRARYGFLLGYVGALSRYYRLEDLVELARRFARREDIGFVVIGQGSEAGAIRERVRSAGLVHFHCLGAILKAQVPATLAELDAGYVGLADIDLHRFGISCNKIYEYMAVGKPIVGSYQTPYDPVADAGCGVVAPPGEPDRLAHGMAEMIADEGLRQRYARRARAYFDSHHDFRVVAKRLADVLFPAASAGPRP